MSLSSGHKLAQYEILAPVGKGGMGEVYRARDTKLEREVAIKVLPAEHASDGERRERFKREAKAIAALNHPHICTLFDFDSDDGLDFLVMEHLSGESLAARMARGPLPLSRAISVSLQIVGALDKAHRSGIIHRDLKPANVFLTEDGAKLLDFGLATLQDAAMTPGEASTRLTSPGTVVGTVHYMAPELFDGLSATTSTDVWAFGCVLYEMLTGEKPFDGASMVELVAAISNKEPTWKLLPVSTPGEIHRLLRRCIQKQVERRIQDIADARLELWDAQESPSAPSHAVTPTAETSELVVQSWTLGTDVCRQLDRESFDAAILGDHMEYVDNQRESDTLAVYLAPVGMDHSVFSETLRSSSYRGIALTLFGMELARSRRIPLRISDHFTLVRLFLEQLSERIPSATTILVGFSSGGDFAIRQLTEGGVSSSHVDGVVALGPNIDASSCFYTSAIANISDDETEGVFQVVKNLMGMVDSEETWLRHSPYWIDLVRKHRNDVKAVRTLARDILAPFIDGSEQPFAKRYRALRESRVVTRIVMSGTDDEQIPLKKLLLAHMDEEVLGPDFNDADFVTEPDKNHFELTEPDVIERHLKGILERRPAPDVPSLNP